LVVDQRLNQSHAVTAIVRRLDLKPEKLNLNLNLNLNKIKAAVDKLTSAEMAIHLKNSDAVISCLGTTSTSKIYLAGLAC
jgi:putative NADH-flavin reductase